MKTVTIAGGVAERMKPILDEQQKKKLQEMISRIGERDDHPTARPSAA